VLTVRHLYHYRLMKAVHRILFTCSLLHHAREVVPSFGCHLFAGMHAYTAA
jgi:hypothetical protein